MQEQSKLKLQLELMWWVFTVILVIAVFAPIYQGGVEYPFYFSNAVFIVVFVTVTRYTFLLKYTWLARLKWLKVVIVLMSAILIFILINSLFDFRNYMSEIGLHEVVSELPFKDQYSMIQYIQREMMFFGIGGVIALIVFPLRMLISIWRLKHTVTKV